MPSSQHTSPSGPAEAPHAALSGIDWSRPWLTPWRERGQPVASTAQCLCSAAAVAQAFNAQRRPLSVGDGNLGPVRFVSQATLPAGEPYERFIFETGTVPTRDNLHDFFNGLAWLHFPHSKRRLNQLQAAEIERAGIGPVRGPLRDALTLFDENGAVLDAPLELWDALVARDWQRLFVTERGHWQQARLLVFGHALLEKLVSPRKGLVAHVLLAPRAMELIAKSDAEVDAALAGLIDASWLAGKPFAPLPVMGVPGWWPTNEAPDFYDDTDVFRPPRPS